jgi:hypothetical protein
MNGTLRISGRKRDEVTGKFKKKKKKKKEKNTLGAS